MNAAARPWAYSAFAVEVGAVERLSPRFVRLTLRGESLAHFAPWGLDQRIKVVLPLAGGGLADFGLMAEPTPHPSDWYARWRSLDEDARNVLRTYTPSAIRVAEREIDVDFFLHEPAGPASAWAAAARPGDPLVITGPDSRVGWTGYGIHWAASRARRALLVGDETAYPAMRNIVAALSPDARPHLIVAMGDPADDVLTGDLPPTASATRVLHGARGDALTDAVRAWVDAAGADLQESDDVSAGDDGFAVWLAGEAGDVTGIRRLLTREAGVAKEQISFLGYWRHGGPLVG